MFVKTALAGIICNLAISGLGFAVLIRPIPVMNPTIATLETLLTATENPIALNYSRMGIGGVRLGMSVEAAKRKLGKPQRDETKPAGPAIGGKIRTLTYQGLTVAAWEGKVYLMSTTNPKFTTIDGVKVGDIAILNHSCRYVGAVPPVPALRGIGQPRGDCPYKNYANDLGSL
jgi:hypothetical protein